MENQHKHIKGYRDLSPAEIARMNEVKELAEKAGELCDRLANARVEVTHDIFSGVFTHIPDPRWVAIGRTQLQQGFMALTRAIAKPTTF